MLCWPKDVPWLRSEMERWRNEACSEAHCVYCSTARRFPGLLQPDVCPACLAAMFRQLKPLPAAAPTQRRTP